MITPLTFNLRTYTGACLATLTILHVLVTLSGATNLWANMALADLTSCGLVNSKSIFAEHFTHDWRAFRLNWFRVASTFWTSGGIIGPPVLTEHVTSYGQTLFTGTSLTTVLRVHVAMLTSLWTINSRAVTLASLTTSRVGHVFITLGGASNLRTLVALADVTACCIVGHESILALHLAHDRRAVTAFAGLAAE